MALALARSIWVIHWAVMVWIAVAWSLPWSWALWAALISHPLVLLNWWIFGNRCVLTVLEERLRARAADPSLTARLPDEPLDFVSRVLSLVLRRPVSRTQGSVVSHTFLWGGLAIAAARLAAR